MLQSAGTGENVCNGSQERDQNRDKSKGRTEEQGVRTRSETAKHGSSNGADSANDGGDGALDGADGTTNEASDGVSLAAEDATNNLGRMSIAVSNTVRSTIYSEKKIHSRSQQ